MDVSTTNLNPFRNIQAHSFVKFWIRAGQAVSPSPTVSPGTFYRCAISNELEYQDDFLRTTREVGPPVASVMCRWVPPSLCHCHCECLGATKQVSMLSSKEGTVELEGTMLGREAIIPGNLSAYSLQPGEHPSLDIQPAELPNINTNGRDNIFGCLGVVLTQCHMLFSFLCALHKHRSCVGWSWDYYIWFCYWLTGAQVYRGVKRTRLPGGCTPSSTDEGREFCMLDS